MNDKQFEKILIRLDAIARLITLTLPKEITQEQKISILSELGLQPKEIAGIIGSTANTVSVLLNKIKRKKSNKKN